MRLIKKNSYPLEKCYSIGLIFYHGKNHLVIGAEKNNKCLLFDLDGNFKETIWDKPGGTMSIVSIPEGNGSFLATQKFYSPNDSKEAQIVLAEPIIKNNWSITKLAKVPFVHRFDILESDTSRYLFIATIKSDHHYKDDWSHPGQVLVAKLPPKINANTILNIQLLHDNLMRNHGYTRKKNSQGSYGVISCAEGVYEYIPPNSQVNEWKIQKICNDSISDIAFVDFDLDGKEEMLALSPFHGDTVSIYKKEEFFFTPQYTFPKRLEFAHSLWAGLIFGKPFALVGHRKGKSRDLYAVEYKNNTYNFEMLIQDCGSTNILVYENEKKTYLCSTNREINEIAFYAIEE